MKLIFFINKVSGITFSNETISHDTRSMYHGRWYLMQPFWARPSALQGSGQAMIDEYESQLSSPSSSPTNLPFFKKNKMDGTLRQLTRKKRKALQATQSDLLKQCTKPRPRLPTQESTSTLCAIFLSHLDCTSLEPDALKCVDDASNLFFFRNAHPHLLWGATPNDWPMSWMPYQWRCSSRASKGVIPKQR